MTRYPGRALAAALVLTFLAAAMLPLAAADHAYSHRYLVYGRVVDEAGNPIVDQQVDLAVDQTLLNFNKLCSRDMPNAETEAWGQTTTQPTTNEFGEFMFCFHVHSLPRVTPSTVTVKVLGAEASETMDTHFRSSYLTLVVPGEQGDANATAFHDTYLVAGRLWYAQQRKVVENIDVFGDTVQDSPVKITMTFADGTTETRETTSNGYGDFAVRLNATQSVEGAKIRIEGGGKTFNFDADPKFRSTDVNLEVPEPGSALQKAIRYVPLVILLGVLIGGSWFLFGRGGPKEKTPMKKKVNKSKKQRIER